jgi:hypothetical protein
MRAQQIRGIGAPPQVMPPRDFPVAHRCLGILGERFVAGPVQRFIGVHLVFGQVAIGRGHQRLQAPRRSRIETPQLIHNRGHFLLIVEPAGALQQIVETLGIGIRGERFKRRQLAMRGGGFLRVVIRHAYAHARQVAIRSAELRNQRLQLLTSLLHLPGLEQLQRAPQHRVGHGGWVVVAHLRVQAAELRPGVGGFGRCGISIIDALIIHGGADGVAPGGEGSGQRQIPLWLGEHGVVLAQQFHGGLRAAVLNGRLRRKQV